MTWVDRQPLCAESMLATLNGEGPSSSVAALGRALRAGSAVTIVEDWETSGESAIALVEALYLLLTDPN